MAEQKWDDQLEHTYSSYVRIRDVALKTCRRRWKIGRSGERGSGISVLAARHDDDDEFESECDCSTRYWTPYYYITIQHFSPYTTEFPLSHNYLGVRGFINLHKVFSLKVHNSMMGLNSFPPMPLSCPSSISPWSAPIPMGSVISRATVNTISCLNFWDETWWFLSLSVFGLLSSSLLLFP